MDMPRGRAVLEEESPFRPDAVLGPRLAFDGYELLLSYPADDDAHVRVSFEGLDAFRCARGEYDPYECEDVVCVVEPSAWLVERHAYEAEHYGDSYEWGRGADTMLTDTHHYVFLFHDEFVEVLARGLWFERHDDPDAPRAPSHPANDLGAETRIEAGERDGLRYEVRANPRGPEALIADGRLHSQTLFELWIGDLERPSERVRLRAGLDGREVRAWHENFLGVESATFDHVPAPEEVMPLFHASMTEQAERRKTMPVIQPPPRRRGFGRRRRR